MPEFNLIEAFEELNQLGLSAEEKASLIDYCKDIETLAKEKVGVLFKNQGNLHAAVVMSTIFSHSTKSIKIFAGNFNGNVSGVSIWAKALAFTFDKNPGLNIEVLLAEKPPHDSIAIKTLNTLDKKSPGRISISVLKSESKLLAANNQAINYHFTVGDDNMFRMETETGTFKAVGNFDDKKSAGQLIDTFTILKIQSTPYEA